MYGFPANMCTYLGCSRLRRFFNTAGSCLGRQLVGVLSVLNPQQLVILLRLDVRTCLLKEVCTLILKCRGNKYLVYVHS